MKRIISMIIGLMMFTTVNPIHANVDLEIDVEGMVNGYVNEPINGKVVTITLTDDNYIFDSSAVDVGDNITDWFITSIPDGLTATVTDFSESVLQVSFEGIVTEEYNKQISVTVPDPVIIPNDGSESIGDLDNEPSDKAKFIIQKRVPSAEYTGPFTVSGIVKEDLEVQYVYIRLVNTKATENMMNAELDLYNRLHGKVVEVSSDQILKVEYTGVPENEDHSEIDITIPAALTECNEDLKVPNREDVIFDIDPRQNESDTHEETVKVIVDKQIETAEKEVVKYIYVQHSIPRTGVE